MFLLRNLSKIFFQENFRVTAVKPLKQHYHPTAPSPPPHLPLPIDFRDLKKGIKHTQ